MNYERDERWAVVALAVLAVAYVVYRYVGSDGLEGIRISPPDIQFGKLGKLGKSLPYMFAPLFAVLSEVYRRRKAKLAREDWENRVRTEGFLRQQENVAVRFSEGASGKFQGDVRLTRVALYVLDRSWRRGPTRLVFTPTAGEEPVLQDVEVVAGKTPELAIVRIRTGGPSKFRLEFTSSEAQAWRSDLMHLSRGTRGAETLDEETRE